MKYYIAVDIDTETYYASNAFDLKENFWSLWSEPIMGTSWETEDAALLAQELAPPQIKFEGKVVGLC